MFSTAFIKGRSNFPNVRLALGAATSTSSLTSENPLEKPWKHQKREKKEKLRIKYAYLDQH
jgi:large subunit GTPase 1